MKMFSLQRCFGLKIEAKIEWSLTIFDFNLGTLLLSSALVRSVVNMLRSRKWIMFAVGWTCYFKWGLVITRFSENRLISLVRFNQRDIDWRARFESILTRNLFRSHENLRWLCVAIYFNKKAGLSIVNWIVIYSHFSLDARNVVNEFDLVMDFEASPRFNQSFSSNN